MDEVDRANHLAEMDLRWRLLEACGSVSGEKSALECEWCGEKIPEKRRTAIKGCRYCVGCQRDIEEGKL